MSMNKRKRLQVRKCTPGIFLRDSPRSLWQTRRTWSWEQCMSTGSWPPAGRTAHPPDRTSPWRSWTHSCCCRSCCCNSSSQRSIRAWEAADLMWKFMQRQHKIHSNRNVRKTHLLKDNRFSKSLFLNARVTGLVPSYPTCAMASPIFNA